MLIHEEDLNQKDVKKQPIVLLIILNEGYQTTLKFKALSSEDKQYLELSKSIEKLLRCKESNSFTYEVDWETNSIEIRSLTSNICLKLLIELSNLIPCIVLSSNSSRKALNNIKSWNVVIQSRLGFLNCILKFFNNRINTIYFLRKLEPSKFQDRTVEVLDWCPEMIVIRFNQDNIELENLIKTHIGFHKSSPSSSFVFYSQMEYSDKKYLLYADSGKDRRDRLENLKYKLKKQDYNLRINPYFTRSRLILD